MTIDFTPQKPGEALRTIAVPIDDAKYLLRLLNHVEFRSPQKAEEIQTVSWHLYSLLMTEQRIFRESKADDTPTQISRSDSRDPDLAALLSLLIMSIEHIANGSEKDLRDRLQANLSVARKSYVRWMNR